MQALICKVFLSTGHEFNNAIVDELFKLSGVRHKVSSQYNLSQTNLKFGKKNP